MSPTLGMTGKSTDWFLREEAIRTRDTDKNYASCHQAEQLTPKVDRQERASAEAIASLKGLVERDNKVTNSLVHANGETTKGLAKTMAAQMEGLRRAIRTGHRGCPARQATRPGA